MRPTIIISEKRKRNDYSFVVLKPTQDSGFSRSVLNRSGKNVLFAHSTSPLPQVIASQDTGRHQTWEIVCSAKLRVLTAKFDGRRWSVSRSCLGRGSLTHFCMIFFWSQVTSCSVSQKLVQNGSATTSQAISRDTDHLRPSDLAARTLSLV